MTRKVTQRSLNAVRKNTCQNTDPRAVNAFTTYNVSGRITERKNRVHQRCQVFDENSTNLLEDQSYCAFCCTSAIGSTVADRTSVAIDDESLID